MPKRRRVPPGRRAPTMPATAGRELVVIARPEAGLRASAEAVASVTEVDVTPLARILASEKVTMQPLFGTSEDRLSVEAMSMPAMAYAPVPDLSVFYRVLAPDAKLDRIAERLRKSKLVSAAYVKPPAEPASFFRDTMAAGGVGPPTTTPDFTSRQEYLDAAPTGVDARYAWTQLGGRGAGVQVVDVEGAWNFAHEDLLQNQGGVAGGTPTTDMGWRNHGTAVVGVIGGDANTFGVTGISPDANVRAVSIYGGPPGWGSAAAIRQAANMVGPGDIVLIELHRGGPRRLATSPRQFGYIAVEWWPDDFAAIQYATSRGVIVVEAAGNGEQDLDDPIYDTPSPGFPSDWTNPFDRANRDSGAILVGAGNPPSGTHGRTTEPIYGEPYVDRARCSFSNFGASVDVQGWGWEVTTTGYGDLQDGANAENLWYTDTFSGTSSASPVIVGVLACTQGWRRATNQAPWTPAQARNHLRTTGSPQQAATNRPVSQRIGNRPDLRQFVGFVVAPCPPNPKCLAAPKVCPPAPGCLVGPIKECKVAPKTCKVAPKICPPAPEVLCPPAPKLACPPAPKLACPPGPISGCPAGPKVGPIKIEQVRQVRRKRRRRTKR